MFEDDFGASFLLRFICMEFGIPNFKLFHNIDICDWDFELLEL